MIVEHFSHDRSQSFLIQVDPTTIKMGFVYGSGQIVGVEQFCTYVTYVAIYVVNVGIIFLLAPRGDFNHVEMCIFKSLYFFS